MAFIEKTAFEVKVSNHVYDSLANITGKFQDSGEDAEICPGFLCVRDALIPNEGYENVGPTGATVTLNNTNTWNMKAAGANDTAQKGIYACNPHDVNMVTDGQGNMWKVGANTLSIKVPKGYLTTWTRIRFDNDHVYRIGVGNLSAEIGENKYLTIADGKFVPAAAAPTGAGKPYFEVVGTGTFTEGAYSAFDYVDARACVSEA